MSVTEAAQRPILREDQRKAKSDLWACIRGGQKRVLLHAPTGWGKGFLCGDIIHSVRNANRAVLFIVNRREIVKDQSRRLDRLGIDHGIIMGNSSRRKQWLNVHVASIDTLRRREHLPKVDLIFVDEARFSVSPTWLETLARFGDVPVIGMDATPARVDGRGLGDLFDVIVPTLSVLECEEKGFLVPTRVYAPSLPDLKGVESQGGDYNQKQLANAVDRPKLTGDIVKHWLKLGERRPTVCFAINVEHSKHIVESFIAAGVRSVHVDADTPDQERDRVWAGLRSGSVELVSSVGVVGYGWDEPIVSCAILGRPTTSLSLYLQQIGRVKRSYPGKTHSLILDHAGSTLDHGFDNDEREWTLDGEKRSKKRLPADRASSVRMCLGCWAAFRSTQEACPYCHKVYSRTKQVRVAEGELQEVQREVKLLRKEQWAERLDDGQKKEKYIELQQISAERGYKPGWAVMRFRAMFGVFPPKAWKVASQQQESVAS